MNGAIAILTGTVPWLLHFALASCGLPSAAKLARFLSSLALNLYRFKKSTIKSIEVATLLFSLVDLLACVLLSSPLFTHHSPSLSQGFLALFAWLSVLVNRPFTLDYAKEDWPAPFWNDPLFTHTNRIISVVWAIGFTFCSLFPLIYSNAPAWLFQTVNGAFVLFALAFSSLFPNVYPIRVLGKTIRKLSPGQWEFPSLKPAPKGFDVIVIGEGLASLSAATLLAKGKRRVLLVRDKPILPKETSPEFWNTSCPDLFNLFLEQSNLALAPQEQLNPKELFPILNNHIPELGQLLANTAQLRRELLPSPEKNHIAPYSPNDANDLFNLPAHLPLLFPWLENPFEQFIRHNLPDRAVADQLMQQLESHFPQIRSLQTGRSIVLMGALHEGMLRYSTLGDGSPKAVLMRHLLHNHRVTVIPNHGGYTLKQEQGTIRGVRLEGGALWHSPIVIMPGKGFDAHPWIYASKAVQRGLVLVDESSIDDLAWLSGTAAAEQILASSRTASNSALSGSLDLPRARSKSSRRLRAPSPTPQ